ncbi:MAG: Holliday junction resolvase-like protein [Chthonomonadales bacterium]
MPTLTPIALQQVIMTLAGLSLLLGLICIIAIGRAQKYRQQLEDERFRQKSLSTTYGKISEQWFPLMDGFPYDSQGFRFLGNPIDGIQFEEDRIIFCEFKANRSGLSTDQRRIRDLVNAGEVYWEEFRFSDGD